MGEPLVAGRFLLPENGPPQEEALEEVLHQSLVIAFQNVEDEAIAHM